MLIDAVAQNIPDGPSTKGLVEGIGPSSVLKGEETPVSLISWRSSKTDRVCHSSGVAETRAAIDGEDHLYATRYQWSELLGNVPKLDSPDEHVRKVVGCVITDSRNVYDKLQHTVLTPKGKESVQILKFSVSRTQWTHADSPFDGSMETLNLPTPLAVKI